jgi:hypothetical protein
VNLRGDRLVVFDLLPGPLVGIDRRRRRQLPLSLAALVRWRRWCQGRPARPLVQRADALGTLDRARSLGPYRRAAAIAARPP